MDALEQGRELGTIVAWDAAGMGRIRADDGDTIAFFYWSVLQGLRQLAIGQRFEFSRTPFGPQRKVAILMVPAPAEPGLN